MMAGRRTSARRDEAMRRKGNTMRDVMVGKEGLNENARKLADIHKSGPDSQILFEFRESECVTRTINPFKV